MIYRECAIVGAAVALLISVSYIIIGKERRRFLQTEFFLGFLAICYRLIWQMENDYDFWYSDIGNVPDGVWYLIFIFLIPLLAAGLAWLVYFAVHRFLTGRRREIVAGASYAAVILILFLMSDTIYSRIYDMGRTLWYERLAEKELELIPGRGSEKEFSYLIPVSDGMEGIGFLNEYGEEVLQCQFDRYGPAEHFDSGFRMAVERHVWLGEHKEDWRHYIVDENGRQIGDQYYSDILAFSAEKNMILVRSASNYKYGAVDGDGNEIIPFEYEYDQIWKESGIDQEQQSLPEPVLEKDGLHIEENEEEIPYVSDDEGNIIIPAEYEQDQYYEYNRDIWFAENGSPYIFVDSSVIDDSTIAFATTLYDYKGNEVASSGNGDIHAESENGWIYIRDDDTGKIVYVDENMKTVLDLGAKYEYAYGAICVD